MTAASPLRLPILALLLVASTTGCASLPSTHADQFIIVRKDGITIDTDRREVTDFGRVWQPIRDRITQYIDEASRKGDRPRLILHVHGGLNTYSGALERVDATLAAQTALGPAGQPANKQLAQYHFLFLNWDSSLLTSVGDDLFTLRFGEERPLQGIPTSPFITGSRLATSGLGAPQSLLSQLSNANDALIVRESQPWRECTVPERPPGSRSSAWAVGNGVAFVGFYPIRAASVPIIQGFGTPAWDTMKRRAELVMAPRRGLSLSLPPEAKGGGRLLVDALQEEMKSNPAWSTLTVTLVGHSMGAIVLNHLLTAYSDMSFETIIYMAAAASIDDVRNAVNPYLRRHPETTFWGFSLSETHEALEWDFLDMFDRGSLLVWIDHYFERINAPGDRAFGRAKNLRGYFEIPAEFTEASGRPRRFRLAKFGNGSSDPVRHGDFSKPEILERVLEIVAGTEQCEPKP